MAEQIQEFYAEFLKAITNAERFLCAARAKEFQVEAINQLQAVKRKAQELKATIVAKGMEDLANRMFSYEQVLDTLSSELNMWVAFKDYNPDVAWDALIDAQTSACTAMQAHEASSHLTDYIERLHALENLLFPNITFLSAGALIKRSTCSICGEEYGDCNHIKGKAYMGELCARRIDEAKILEASIVKTPANKHCRITRFTENGVTRDTMTWRIVPDEGEANGQTAEGIICADVEVS